MDNGTFGLTMLLVGMGGTLLSLFGLTLLIHGIRALFPAKGDSAPGTGSDRDGHE